MRRTLPSGLVPLLALVSLLSLLLVACGGGAGDGPGDIRRTPIITPFPDVTVGPAPAADELTLVPFDGPTYSMRVPEGWNQQELQGSIGFVHRNELDFPDSELTLACRFSFEGTADPADVQYDDRQALNRAAPEYGPVVDTTVDGMSGIRTYYSVALGGFTVANNVAYFGTGDGCVYRLALSVYGNADPQSYEAKFQEILDSFSLRDEGS